MTQSIAANRSNYFFLWLEDNDKLHNLVADAYCCAARQCGFFYCIYSCCCSPAAAKNFKDIEEGKARHK